MINLKLDLIMNKLDISRLLPLNQQGQLVDISGSGLRFPCLQKFSIGDIINFDITLPSLPQTFINGVGVVVRIFKNDKDKDNEIALKYIAINEEDRNKIIHYTKTRQKELLSQKRL